VTVTGGIVNGGIGNVVDVVELLESLVTIDSQNPSLQPDSPGEGPLARYVGEWLQRHGIDVSLHEALPDRPNVVATLPGSTGAPTLLFEAHLDTVPCPPGGIGLRREGDRLHGRGTCDTKASLAAMMAALVDLAERDQPRATVVLAGVVDEEFTMHGAAALVDSLPPVLGAVIGEPTSLLPIRAHNGFMRVKLHAHGRAAHSSKAHLGQNAVVDASRAIVALADSLGEDLRTRGGHRLIGPALLTPTMVRGGIAPNVVPDSCEVTLDRRLAPGEQVQDALDELRAAIEAVPAEGTLCLGEPAIGLPGVETAADHPLVVMLTKAIAEVVGEEHEAGGVPYSTDACRLGGVGGIDCVVFGPGSIDQAHTDNEWVDLREVEQAVPILVRLAELAGDVAS
jgi:acetylornithine deacetylase